MGSTGTLEDKTVTVCYGPDIVNLTFVNFCCLKPETAKVRTRILVGRTFLERLSLLSET